ncbi:inositol monophosphatase family protein [Mucilaginibacter sp. P25]|uniref:Fructose-1,6-bisphosphatase n=1 Tax=Mucilaginibacter gossypii TaxID=551996 RepID=A0A1G7WFJ0_9SPHI|nr:inositol monophosphatase family protein [Mucilaginibacter gossypii]SDG70509.1 fructose-1,6-bisphosphatase [Mucilaginibacter gossypii]
MYTSPLKKYLDVAVKAAEMASELLLQAKQAPVKINSSVNKDIKLDADVQSESLIVKYLAENSPYDILSEESGTVKTSADQTLRWIVDPLDGSLNFSRDFDMYGVSIGLWDGGQPVLGVIYDFNHGKMYTGIVGDGAYCNNQKIQVSNIADRKDSIIATGFPVYSDFDQDSLLKFVSNIQVYKKVRLLGSAALSLIMVAKGSMEVYMEDNIAIWDVAAGLAILEAAGGYYELSAGKGDNYLKVFASNGQVK